MIDGSIVIEADSDPCFAFADASEDRTADVVATPSKDAPLSHPKRKRSAAQPDASATGEKWAWR